ncbi:MAG: hypothetical protein JXB62_07880 [Pirellulales bacterium]|nr:hypothetical protein [Pirellulales bacterium]
MSTALDIEKIVCRHCYAVLDVGDSFCRHCGVPTGPASSAPWSPGAASAAPPAMRRGHGLATSRWSENRWVVLAMLFLVLGPVGLPMLWRSRQFSRTWKTVLTTFVLGVTVAIVGLIWYVFNKTLAPLRELGL